MTFKQVLVIDKDRRMIYADVLKTMPVLCREHQSYVWYRNNDDKNSFYCKKGKHTIAYESEEFELVEI